MGIKNGLRSNPEQLCVGYENNSAITCMFQPLKHRFPKSGFTSTRTGVQMAVFACAL